MNNSRYDVEFHTFGCKVNTYDTGLLQKRFAAIATHPIDTGATLPKVHVLNTCAVTAEATREAAKFARRLKSREPLAIVVVTGCGAQVDGEVYDGMPAVDLVVANSHKGKLEGILDGYFRGDFGGDAGTKVFRSNIFQKDDLEGGGGIEAGHTRAFVKIQDGCNSFCTFCVIPFARGKSRSLSISDIVTRVSELRAQNGVVEVVLTGVHIGDYAEGALVLPDLVNAILEKTDLPRLRLTSLEPIELSPRLLELFKSDRVCPHFHMSIQSACSKILQSMRRQYDAIAVEDALKSIDREVPNAFVGMDVIAGFPGESDHDFAETYERLMGLPWTRLHVFPYSERPGTKAARLTEQVDRSKRARRAERLRELSAQRFAFAATKQIGSRKRALVLRAKQEGIFETLTRDYWPVRVAGALTQGREIEVEITEFSNAERFEGALIGKQVGGVH